MKNIHHFITSIAILVCLTQLASAQEDQESRVKRLKARLAPALALSLEELKIALSIKVHERFDGASIIADDGEKTFLGKIDSSVAGDSIFNEVGRHGSEVSSQSIWNEVGRYGSEVARHSPFNAVTSSPPFIVKGGRVIGRLTVNDVLPGAVDPDWLKSFYRR
jgi:hypothetical protein